MYKFLLAVVVLSGSISAFGQYDSTEGRMEETLPEAKVEEDTNYKWNIGLISGVNSPEGDVTSSVEYGVTTNFEPVKHLGLGVDVNTSELDDANQNQRTFVQFKTAYVVGGDTPVLKNTYVGVVGGPIFEDNKVHWGYGPLAGMDFPLSSRSHDYMSLGLTAKYLINQDTPDSLSAGAAIKYWF